MTLSRYFATPQQPVVVPGKHPFETPASSNPLLLQPPVPVRKDSPTGLINSPKLPDVVVSQLLKWGKRSSSAISAESVESVRSVTQNVVSASNDARFGEQPSQKLILLVEDNAVNLRVPSSTSPAFSEIDPLAASCQVCGKAGHRLRNGREWCRRRSEISRSLYTIQPHSYGFVILTSSLVSSNSGLQTYQCR